MNHIINGLVLNVHRLNSPTHTKTVVFASHSKLNSSYKNSRQGRPQNRSQNSLTLFEIANSTVGLRYGNTQAIGGPHGT